jgi:iron complex outermembrane receptor protein
VVPGRRLTPLFATRCRAQYAAAGIGIDADGTVDPYGADSLWNYEVGLKTQTADRKLTFNAAAYSIDWKNIQQLYFPSCGAASTQNFGKARIRGLEADFNLKLVEQFALFGGVNFNSAKIAHDIPELGVLKGTALQNTPKFSANLNARYGFDGPFGAQAHHSRQCPPYRESHSAILTGPTRPNIRTNTRWLACAQAWTFGAVEATLYVDNLFDKAPVISNQLSSFGLIPSRERGFTVQPRTAGVSFRADF